MYITQIVQWLLGWTLYFFAAIGKGVATVLPPLRQYNLTLVGIVSVVVFSVGLRVIFGTHGSKK